MGDTPTAHYQWAPAAGSTLHPYFQKNEVKNHPPQDALGKRSPCCIAVRQALFMYPNSIPRRLILHFVQNDRGQRPAFPCFLDYRALALGRHPAANMESPQSRRRAALGAFPLHLSHFIRDAGNCYGWVMARYTILLICPRVALRPERNCRQPEPQL